MKVELIQMDASEARRQYRLYSEQAKRAEAPAYVKELRRAYWHLKKGKQVIDVLAALQTCGLNSEGNPLLALARAEHKTARFEKLQNGALIFWSHPEAQKSAETWDWKREHKVIDTPAGTFPEWRTASGPPHYGIVNRRATAPIPIVPASILVRCRTADVSGLFILWEVEKWTPSPPSDPILLMRLSKYLFVVIGQWDLTPLEKSIIRART